MLTGRGGFRRASATLAMAAVVFAFTGTNPGEGRGAPTEARAATVRERFSSLSTILRLRDLPIGYRLLNFGPSPDFRAQPLTCDRVHPANAQPSLASFLRRYSPTGCYGTYFRLFHVAGTTPASLAVGSGAMETRSGEAAEAGLAAAPELLSHLIGDTMPEEVPSPATIGDGTRLFHWRHPALFKESERPDSSFLVWRSGSIDAAIFVTGGTPEANDRAAFELAPLQQRRIESRSPVALSEFDSAEVALEDPRLEIPVYWLGRRFSPRHGLPPLRLSDSASTSTAGSLSPRVSLFYVDGPIHNQTEAISLGLWSRRQWKLLEAKRDKLPGVPSCETDKPLRIARDHTVIYRGFEGGPHGCGSRARRGSYTAQVYLGRAIATAETMEVCAVCASAGTGPYDSQAGMEAIAHGLVLRPPRTP